MKKNIRLIWHIYPSYLLIIVFAFLAVSLYSSGFLEKTFLARTRKDLFVRGQLLKNQIAGHLNPIDVNKISEICLDAGRASNTRITVILPDGKVIGDSKENPSIMDNHKNRPEVLTALEGEAGSAVRSSETLRVSMMYVAIPLIVENKINAILRTSIPVTEIDMAIKAVQFRLLLVGLIVAALASVISFFVSCRLSRPIEEMKQGAVKFADGKLNHRLHSSSILELASLAEAMNKMAFQLEERIRIEENQKNEYRAVLSSMAEGVVGIDLNENIISINQAARDMLNTGTGDVAGHSVQELVRNQGFIEFVQDAAVTESTLEVDFSLKNEENIVINIRSSVLRSSDNNRIGTLIVLNDVTHVRMLENVRQDFVANVSHEIKTPLTAIKGFVETLMLMEDANSEDEERFLMIILKHVDRLGAILDDLLSLSRIEQQSRQNHLDTEKSSLKDIFETVLQVVEAKANEKNISFEYSLGDTNLVEIDARLLEQALVNLVDNAVKYSYENTIVSLSATADNNELTISVSDQGQGIPEKHLPRIFERFYRVDKARSRKLGGTGLGLAIVKHIVLAHGGHVSIESSVGKGTVFNIHLPL